MKIYNKVGESFLVCPKLLEIDKRHGDFPRDWPKCRRGHLCSLKHDHESKLEIIDPKLADHRVIHMPFFPGSRMFTPEERKQLLSCNCGEECVWSDLDDPYNGEYLTEVINI